MKFLKKNWITILLTILALGGAGLIAYPTFSDWWNSFNQSRAVASYADKVANMSVADYEPIFESADAYNEGLARSGIRWTMTDEEREAYNKELDITGTGIMGYINIPVIDVLYPIYHGTNESVLQIATGHIEGSSLPVGGAGTHTIISGHTGLPSAKIFTNVRDLVVGDTWTITVLNRTLTYEVDQILIVEPYDLSSLQIEKDKDYCTLVTCWPERLNTHRLLVRGHRVENEQGEAAVVADAMQIRPVYIAPFIAAPVLLLLILIMLLSTGHRSREKKRKNPEQGGKKAA